MPKDPIEREFELTDGGVFLKRDGRARSSATKPSQKKLCFVATDRAFLAELLFELSERPDCCFVKLTAEPRDGMYLGRCFVMDDEVAGQLWAEYKRHPRLMCSLQDDDFTLRFRPSQR